MYFLRNMYILVKAVVHRTPPKNKFLETTILVRGYIYLNGEILRNVWITKAQFVS